MPVQRMSSGGSAMLMRQVSAADAYRPDDWRKSDGDT